jgi:DNA repair protein RadC
MPEGDRPRERMIEKGTDSLSVAELLSVVLVTGSKKEDVASLSRRILKEYGERSISFYKDPTVISKEMSIPVNKACQVVACFELGRRFFKDDQSGRKAIRNVGQAFEYFKELGKLQKECLRGIYLNSHYQVIHDETISLGSATSSIIHPREVFAPAIEHYAVAVIIAHNHPSGSLKPTKSDIEVTGLLVEAGKILGIELLDHLIIAKGKYLSIKKEKNESHL